MSDPTPTPTPTPEPAPAPMPAPEGDGKQQSGEQHVPYARFKQVNDQLAELKQKLTALTGEKEQQTTAAKTLEDRVAQIQQDLASERAEKLRLKVAGAKQLPPELVDRLRGETEEELLADADQLLTFVKPKGGPGVPPPSGGGHAPKFDLNGKTPAEIRKAYDEGKINL